MEKLKLKPDLIAAGPENHHWKSHLLLLDFEYSCSLIAQTKPTTLQHLVSSKLFPNLLLQCKKPFFLTTRLSCKMEMTSSSKSSHETTQRLIYINLLPDQLLDNSLNFRIWSANFSLPVFPPSITSSFPF